MLNLFILILGLSPQIEDKLGKHGFMIVPTMERNIYNIYESAKKNNEPILVTQDVVLHTAHILFDYTLRILELETLLPKVTKLTKGMLEASQVQSNKAKTEAIELASLDNLAFFAVAGKLLGIELPEEIPEDVKEKIDYEVDLIEAHKGFVSSPIFGYMEDYTQYIPRGHYTRNVDFESYFKAMMWYGRMGFYLKPHPTMYSRPIDPTEEGIKLTRRAILITRIIKSSPALAKLWNEVYKPTTFFAGKADDFTIQDYEKLLKGVYLSRDKSVFLFIKKAGKLPRPKITSTLTEDTLGLMGFRFMGQRFIPDSYIFQNLVYPKVDKYLGQGHPFTLELTPFGPLRCFPRGLDVMWIFGNEAAGDILKEEGDTDYKNYDEQVKKLKAEFAKLPQSQWKENLYWQWLYVLKLLVTHPQKAGYPKFMQSRLWALKELNAALGSWAELRHDTILYAKQSYTLMGSAMPKPQELTQGWIEPYPEIYKWLSEFIKELSTTSKYPKEVEDKLMSFSKILTKFSTISEKELEDTPLSETEHRLIWNIGSTLRDMTRFSPEIMRKITSGADKEMAVIADVHTDPNSGKVLEEAVGHPSVIYVKLPGNRILKGGTFSYYEFKAPMAERYTDEKWQQELRTNPPKPQKWFLPLLSEK